MPQLLQLLRPKKKPDMLSPNRKRNRSPSLSPSKKHLLLLKLQNHLLVLLQHSPEYFTHNNQANLDQSLLFHLVNLKRQHRQWSLRMKIMKKKPLLQPFRVVRNPNRNPQEKICRHPRNIDLLRPLKPICTRQQTTPEIDLEGDRLMILSRQNQQVSNLLLLIAGWPFEMTFTPGTHRPHPPDTTYITSVK